VSAAPRLTTVPVLLLPVRLETRFVSATGGPELWVRMYPDQIHINTFDSSLNATELDHGYTYWAEVAKLQPDDDPVGPWRVLAAAHGSPRAAYIRLMTQYGTTTRPKPSPDQDGRPTPTASLLPSSWNVTAYVVGGAVRTKATVPVTQQNLAVFPDSGTIHDPKGNSVDPGMKWLIDFNEAESKGMAVRISLQPADLTNGIERVIGVGDWNSTPDEGANALEQLIKAQHYTQGFGVVPQGVPTKNTPDAKSPFSRRDPGFLNSYRVEVEGNLAPDKDSNGQVLAAALGIGSDLFQSIDGSEGREQLSAFHMALALWPSTLGYFLRNMMADLVTEKRLEAVRAFFLSNVRGRGRLPAFRVGPVPYGLLPVTSLNRWRQPNPDPVESDILALIRRAQPTWLASAAKTAAVGPGQDPEQTLAGILGMEASSMEFHGRPVLADDFLWNWINFLGFNFGMSSDWWKLHMQASDRVLGLLGLPGRDPVIRRAGLLQGFEVRLDTVAATLSETDRLDGNTPLPDGTQGNYVQWIASATIDDLAQENWPGPGAAPTSLLYKTLRASMLLEYLRATVELLIATNPGAFDLLKEIILLGIGALNVGATAWSWLSLSIPSITGPLTVKQYLVSQGGSDPRLAGLREFKASLAYLATLPTAELDRLLTEVLDTCTNRLDAWSSALANASLDRARANLQRGVYIGGYGYVENLKPAPTQATASVPWMPNAKVQQAKTDNAGYIHAPSPQQAALAAVLKSGDMSHAKTGSPDLLNLDISSDRVRRALWYLDGVRQGQRLGALLGYHFEERMHAQGADLFIQPFRDTYPLQVPVTDPNASRPGGVVSPPNVVDGVALQTAFTSHNLDLGGTWGDKLPATEADQQKVISILQELDDVMNAISNISVAESVFQIMRGNSARASGLLDAVSKGEWAPEPEFLNTTRTGIDINHRVHVLFTGDGAGAANWPNPRTPRGVFESRLDDWLAKLLPDPGTVECSVNYTSGGAPVIKAVKLTDLGAGPLDVLAMANASAQPGHSELEQRILYAADLPAGTSDAAIVFASGVAANISFPDLLTTASALRDLVFGARGLEPNDLIAPEEADPGQEARFVPELLKRADDALAVLVTLEASLKSDTDSLSQLLDQAGQPSRASLDAAADAVAKDLLALLPYGVPGSVPLPRNRQDPTKAPGATEIQTLRAQAVSADNVTQARINVATAYRSANFSTDQRASDVISFFNKVMDESVPAIPKFQPVNGYDLEYVFDRARALVPATNPDAIDLWLHQLSYVRPAIAHLETAMSASQLLQAKPYAPARAIGQLPRQIDPDQWIALEFDVPAKAPTRGRLSILALLEPPNYSRTGTHSGLVIDDWPERIPQTQESSGLVFHYEEPKARAPQCALLALAPDGTLSTWDNDTLRDIVSETFEWAAMRTVDLESLADFGEILPALYYGLNTSLTTVPEAVSTDFGGGPHRI